MSIFTDQYKEQLHAAWEHLIKDKPYDYSFMRPEIYQSWQRSRLFGVNPYAVKTQLLHPHELKQRIHDNLMLIETVRPYMDRLYSFVQGSEFYLLLCDKDGYILALTGDQGIIEEGQKTSLLVVGANRSEEFAGTNAIGTCLTLKKPIQIWNEEHYIKSHKNYACSSAPIFDSNKNLLGCLNITGKYTQLHAHTLGMAISAVDGISKEMKIRKAYNEIETISAQRNSIIETGTSGLILLNESNRIIQINKLALSMLQLSYGDTIGRTLSDLIRFDDPTETDLPLLKRNLPVYNKETNLFFVNRNLSPCKFNVSINYVQSAEGLTSGTVLRLNETKLINKLVNRISGYQSSFTFESIVGSSPQITEMIKFSRQAARSDANILILGESGTGKEVIAQSIHNASTYASGPFIAINCGAIPKGLIESELFGYEKGAFTGASQSGNPGKFELADGGTIFLDEIGDMPLDVQVSLLRVIQSREIIRIGGKYPKPINVRIIAATNKDIDEAVHSKTFREDLYYRLNVFSLQVPPLRNRGNDILEISQFFIEKYNRAKGRHLNLSPEAQQVLLHYHWPGNVRELENAMERAVNVTEEEAIYPQHLPTQVTAAANAAGLSPASYGDINQNSGGLGAAALGSSQPDLNAGAKQRCNLKGNEAQTILSTLQETGGNMKKAADLLGIGRRTLYRKIEKYQIDPKTLR